MTDSTKAFPLLARLRRRAVRAAMACGRAARKLNRDPRGAVAVEYGLVVALIVIAVMFSIVELGKTNLNIWSNVASKVTAAVG